MTSLIRKAIYVLYGKAAEKRRARRLAEEIAAEEKLAEERKAEELAEEQRIADELAHQAQLETERAAKVEAEERRKVNELARQKRLAQERADREATKQRAIEEEAAEQRRIANPFQLGGRYENRKGPFTVIALSEDKVTIRWDSDEKPFTDTIASQARILHNMQRGDVDEHVDGQAEEEDEGVSKRGDNLEEYRREQAEIEENRKEQAEMELEDLTDFEREEVRYNGGPRQKFREDE